MILGVGALWKIVRIPKETLIAALLHRRNTNHMLGLRPIDLGKRRSLPVGCASQSSQRQISIFDYSDSIMHLSASIDSPQWCLWRASPG